VKTRPFSEEFRLALNIISGSTATDRHDVFIVIDPSGAVRFTGDTINSCSIERWLLAFRPWAERGGIVATGCS